MLIIQGMREDYSIRFTESAALIGRPQMNVAPSDTWLLRGLIRLNNFGRQVEFVLWGRIFDVFGNQQTLTYANGKPQWFMADVDHGTPRLMTEGVKRVYMSEESK